MRALFVALDVYSGTGGMQRYCRDAVGALAESGWSPTVVAVRDTPGEAGDLPAGTRLVACRQSRLRAAAAVVSALLRQRPDIVVIGHVLLMPLALAVRVLAPRSRIVLLAYGVDVWRKPAAARAALVRATADRIVAISRTTKTRMGHSYRVEPDRFVVVAPAVGEISKVTPGPTPRGGRRLLTVARLGAADRDKGVDRVVRALPAVLAEFGDLHYSVVGQGPLRAEIATLARELGVGEHVHLLGRVDDGELVALYEGCDAFVMPSRKEGFGIVYLEAWRHGLPVIAGNRDAGAEVVEDGVTGLLVDPESTEGLAAAIKRLLGDPALRGALGEAGRAAVARRHTFAQFRRSFVDAIGGPR